MNDLNITMEEYIRIEEEKARRRGKVFNWETTEYGKIWYDENVHDLRSVETEFPAIVFNDNLTSNETHFCDDETSLSKCDKEEQKILYFNDVFPFNVIYPDDSKSNKDNDDDKIDIKRSSRDMSVIPLPNVINNDDGAYAQRPIRRIHQEDTAYLCLNSPKTTKETSPIRRIQKKAIRRIEDIVCEDSGRYQSWSLLQETSNTPVGTTFDIFQNIRILYLEYGVLSSSGYGVLDFIPLWSLAIKSRFRGNTATKKTQKYLMKQQYENIAASSTEVIEQTYERLQKLISQLEMHGEVISQEDINQKFLRCLSQEWTIVTPPDGAWTEYVSGGVTSSYFEHKARENDL
ncbi:hypothetical protein Tco_1345862 [Tanacetum coccineum]